MSTATAPAFPALRTEIAGLKVAELARRKFGTPSFVYDAAKILERIEDLRAFDHIRYAQKACSNIAILDLMRRRGVLVDATSASAKWRQLAGYSTQGNPAPIVYTADIFDRDSLEVVVEKGIHVNCDSPVMINSARARRGEHHAADRPGFGHGHSQKTNTGGEQSTWHLARATDRLFAAGGPSWFCRSPAPLRILARGPTWVSLASLR